MRVELDRVPLRATGMTPAEILFSESQERMWLSSSRDDVAEFMAICRKWDVLATVVGEVTDDDRLVVTWRGETIVDVAAHRGARGAGLRAAVRASGVAGRVQGTGSSSCRDR